LNRRALAIGVVVLLALSAGALADNDQDQLNRAKAALHGGRYADAKAGFERLAPQGNADAQFYLGRMAAGGMGVPQDTARAVSWYGRSSDRSIRGWR
jgi:TPR repeat protein